MSDNAWTTSITEIQPNRVAVRGCDIADLMGSVSFGAAVYLVLRGKLPTPAIASLMDAILVSSIDHGVTPPSALAARTIASTGASLSASVAAGIMAINRYHGGAIETCAIQLGCIVRRVEETGKSIDQVAADFLAKLKSDGERMSGFGHRIHTNDPRTRRLFDLAAEAGVNGPHVQAARAVERVLCESGKPLPINVDGAIAAVLADLGFEPAVMNGIFMIARAPGLVAHVHEEQTTQKPMRKIDSANHVYSGPSARKINGDGGS